MPHHYLAIDLGASNGRALLGTLQEGQMRMEEVHWFETPLVEEDDRLYWDLEVMEREVETGLQKGLGAAPDLESCSVDSWAVDYVPLDVQEAFLR